MDESGRPPGAPWQALLEDALTGMEDWRTAHPTATFAEVEVEVEVEVETRLGHLRARRLEDAALAGAARTGAATANPDERVRCPACGGALGARGEQVRQVRMRGDRQVALRRTYLTCTACGRGLFPPG